MSINTKKVYTVNEVAEILNISKSGAYNFVNDSADKNLFSVVRINKSIRIIKASFDNWLYGKESNSIPVDMQKKLVVGE